MSTKIIISDCFNLGELKTYNGETLLKPVKTENNLIHLNNGVILEAMNDGRLYNSGDENDKYAEVNEFEIDENGDIIQSVNFLGYIKV